MKSLINWVVFATEKYWDWVKNNSVIKTKIEQHINQKIENENKSTNTSYRILTTHRIITMAIIKFISNNKLIYEKSNQYCGILKDFGKFNLKRACSKHKYIIHYLETCWKNCSTTNLGFWKCWYFVSTRTRLHENSSS